MGNFNSLVFPRPNPPHYDASHENLYWIDRIIKGNDNKSINEPIVKIPYMLCGSSVPSDKILIYFHGNASDLGKSESFCSMIAFYWSINVLAVEYPGYGIYQGVDCNEKNILQDSLIIYDFLTDKMKIQSDQIVVFGRSIGSGPATFLSKERDVSSLILFSPFLSLQKVISEKVSFFSFIVNNKFSNDKWITEVQCPVLFLHGKKDKIVHFTHSQKLSELAVNVKDKYLHISENMGHGKYHVQDDLIKPGLSFFESNGIFNKRDENKIINTNNFFTNQ